MTICRRSLSSYQRRSLRMIELALGLCIGIGMICQAIQARHSLLGASRYGIAVLAIAPIIAAIVLIARYLSGETDEYVRNLVIESMLWGLGAVIVYDTFVSFVEPLAMPIPLGNLSVDIFVVVASARLECKLWREQ